MSFLAPTLDNPDSLFALVKPQVEKWKIEVRVQSRTGCARPRYLFTDIITDLINFCSLPLFIIAIAYI